jgi:hypothetical protein
VSLSFLNYKQGKKKKPILLAELLAPPVKYLAQTDAHGHVIIIVDKWIFIPLALIDTIAK